MAQLLRILNAFCTALFLVMAGVALLFLAAGRDGFARPDANPWTAAGWAALFLLLATLAFLNLRRRLLALNLAAALALLAALALVGGAGRFLCGAAALPFALTALVLVLGRSD